MRPVDTPTMPATRRPPWRTAVLPCLPLLLLAGQAHALRCGNDLVSSGDTSGEVRRLCGEPVSIDEHEELVSYSLTDPATGVVLERTRVVTLVEWTYNFGPTRLMRRLRFENGKLVDSDTLGYGY